MKIVSYLIGAQTSYGAYKDGRVVDLRSRLGSKFETLEAFIANDGQKAAAPIVAQEKGDYDYESIELLPVVPKPGKIACIGVNYQDHADEAARTLNFTINQTQWPMIFTRWPETLTAHRSPIPRAKVSEQLDFEGELLVIMGKSTGRYLDESRALEHVFGYSCMNEACNRDYQFHTRQITPGKNFQGTGATGPWIVTADEIPDPQNLMVEMRLNGEVMQRASTSTMLHSIAKIISYITHWVPLNPGDMIATGTPAGVGLGRTPQLWMKPGDVAEVSIEGIGTLRNVIEDEKIAQPA